LIDVTDCGARCFGITANLSHVNHGQLGGSRVSNVTRGKLFFRHVFRQEGRYAVTVHAPPGQVYDFAVTFSGQGQLLSDVPTGG
jgi:hypothetical protein